MTINKKWPIIWLLLALFILSRILFLFFAYPIFFMEEEELARGVIAQEIITGKLNRPLFDYQQDLYAGASLIVGPLAAPFYLLFGVSVFSLKLVGLSFFAVTLLFWILFCLRFFNRRIAAFFSILFIFSPAFFTEMSLTARGWHSETILFTAVAIFIFYEIFFKQKRRWQYFIALGLVCGMGLWFFYIFGITLLACLLCWFLFDRKFFLRRNFWIFNLGFLFGFSPWIYYNLTHKFGGLYIHGRFLPDFFALDNFFNLFRFKKSVIYDIPASLGLSNIWIFDRKLLSAAYFLVFVIAFISMVWNIRKNLFRSKVSFFIIFCFVMSIAYQLTYNPVLRYLIVLYPFIFITIALFLNRLFESKVRFKMVASISLVSLLALMGFSSNINVLSTRFAGYGLEAKSFLYYGLGLLDTWKREKDAFNLSRASKYFSFARNIDPAYHDVYFRKVSGLLEFKLQDLEELLSLIEQVDPKYRRHFYTSIGRQINWEFPDYGDIDKAKQLISRIGPEYQYYVYEAWVESIAGDNRYIDDGSKKRTVAKIGEAFYPVFYSTTAQYAETNYLDVNSKIERKHLPYFFEGIGESMALAFARHRRKVDINELLKSIDEEYRPFVCKGIGKHLASMVRDESANALIWSRLISELPPLYQRYCEKGFKIEMVPSHDPKSDD